MKFSALFLTALAATTAHALEARIAQSIKEDLRVAKIVPDVVQEFEPQTQMKITYHENKLIDMGSVLLPEEVVQPPHVWFRDPQPGNHYTLAMVDADAEVPLVRHWIATNIDGSKPGTSFRDNSTLHQYTPYHGPTPPAGTGQHRYVFVLFSQQTTNQTMTPVLEDPTVHRAYFNLTQFALDNHLTPVAASYMLAEHQDGYDGGYMSRRASASAAAMKATQAPRSARF